MTIEIPWSDGDGVISVLVDSSTNTATISSKDRQQNFGQQWLVFQTTSGSVEEDKTYLYVQYTDGYCDVSINSLNLDKVYDKDDISYVQVEEDSDMSQLPKELRVDESGALLRISEDQLLRT